MATAPTKPTLSASPASYSIRISYGTSSFGDPSTGVLTLYNVSGAPRALATQTAPGEYYYLVNSGTASWSNTQSTYRAVADNGELSTSSDSVTVVTLPTDFSIGGNVISASNITKHSFDVLWHAVALGTKYQVDLYASIDNKATWVLIAQNIQNATDYTHTFSGLSSGTTYTVYTQTRDSAGRVVDAVSGRTPRVTTLPDPRLYGSVNGQAKKIQKLYGSVNGQAKEIKKLYGSVNDQTKLIYQA